MGYALHRVTKQLLSSINSPSFPAVDWVVAMKNEQNVTTIENLTAAAVPTKYWKIVQPGDVIEEMDAAEKAIVDAAELPQVQPLLVAALPLKAEAYIATRYPDDVQKQISAIFAGSEKFPNRLAYLQKLLDWRETIYKEQQSVADQINAATTLAQALAVVFDTGQFTATDPMVTVEEALNIPD